jgi:hypothetical protein
VNFRFEYQTALRRASAFPRREKWLGPGKWYLLDGDRQVLLASAELNKITYWRKVTLRLPNVQEAVWTLDLHAAPYPIPEYTPWR